MTTIIEETKSAEESAVAPANGADALINQIQSYFEIPPILVPLVPGIKKPVAGAYGYKDFTSAKMADRAYREHFQGADVAVLLGGESGNIGVIDCDNEEFMNQLLEVNPHLEHTTTTKTKDGRHFYYIWTGDVELPSVAKINKPAEATKESSEVTSDVAMTPEVTVVEAEDSQAPSVAVKDDDTIHLGEVRFDRALCKIHGTHEAGSYQVDASHRLIRLGIGDLKLPAGVNCKSPLFWTKEEQLEETAGEPYVVDKDGKISLFNERYFATLFAIENHVTYDPAVKAFYLYNAKNGLWRKCADYKIRNKFATQLHQFSKKKGLPAIRAKNTSNLQCSLMTQLKGKVLNEDAFAPRPHCQDGSGKVCIQLINGVLQLQRGAEPILLPHSETFYHQTAVQLAYDSTATCPLFEKFIKDSMSDDDQGILREFMGMVLLGSNIVNRIQLVQGKTGTGKSVLGDLISRMLGEEKVGSLRTKQLNERFETSGFLHKTLLTALDVSDDFFREKGTNSLKSLTGGDRIEAEFKKGNTRVGKRGEYLIFVTTNHDHIFRVSGIDDAKAFARRLRLIKMDASPVTKPVPNYGAFLYKQEASGILNWQIKGLLNLWASIAEKGAILPVSAEQQLRIDKMVGLSSPLREFVNKAFTKGNQEIVTGSIWSWFQDFCQCHSYGTPLQTSFQKELPELMKEIHQATHNNHIKDVLDGDSEKRGYKGIMVKPLEVLSWTVDPMAVATTANAA